MKVQGDRMPSRGRYLPAPGGPNGREQDRLKILRFTGHGPHVVPFIRASVYLH